MLSVAQVQLARKIRLSRSIKLFDMLNHPQYSKYVEFPGEGVLPLLEEYAEDILQPIWDKFGRLLILSGYRCPALNRQLSKAENSVHQCMYREVVIGAAANFVPLDADIEEVWHWASALPKSTISILYRRPAEVANNAFIHIGMHKGTVPRKKLEKYLTNDYRFFES